MIYDIRSISDRAKGVAPGAVTPDEIEFARNILRTRSGDIYTAIYVVGLLGNKRDGKLVESFIFGDENNLYAEVALKALCRYMGLIEQYRSVLRQLVIQPPDESGMRRMTAIHLMKEYFQDYKDNELGCYLVKILCDLDDRHRLSARDALADILDLRSSLKDPHGLEFDEWDEDTSLLVKAAKNAFHCKDVIVSPKSQIH
ncbi:hypothetical protein PMI07_004658 [Rhizobium sp. CF080]|uniref:hypothetical protein n=1 Tax=Rhizobium sp. (strain CF080) TaxID=1144310 RepID=UPI0002719B84|nr:hypothetical protein [Rhizobium sp. CF080]EUB98377.1 hypothetical protein PMI07_004658 [Rhizobium sp. CF080]